MSAATPGAIHHVGYLTRDLDVTRELFEHLLGVRMVSHIDRPQFSLVGVYLGHDSPQIEVFSFTDDDLLRERLPGSGAILDHIAYRVSDIEDTASRMSAAGVRFAGPDLRQELTEPVELDGVLHLWTIPNTCRGQMIQVLQPASSVAA